MASTFDEILERFDSLDEDKKKKTLQLADTQTKDLYFIPNPGPQFDAYHSPADEVFYGGAAGSGKSSLICGLAVDAHQKSIIFRREFPQIKGLEDEVERIIGSRDGYNSHSKVWRLPKKNQLEFGAVQYEDDKEKFQGRPHDLIAFDEITHFSRSQYTFLIGWNRSATPGQRCRIIATGNPPTRPEGYWVIEHWGPWLDPKHSKPAKPGELRWFTTIAGKEVEVSGRGPHLVDGRKVIARSRTFIPGKLEDNPDLINSGYAATLDAMDEPFRTQLREGRFDIALEDDHWQCIPTAWVKEAQNKWLPTPPQGVPMCTMGVDIAQGGSDNTVIAPRYDGWFAPLIIVPGTKTPDGPSVAGIIIQYRQDNALPVLDMGGGYGGDTYRCLTNNGIDAKAYKGAEGSTQRTKDRKLTFYNTRSAAYWKFREALDPSQLGGSPIRLPDDPKLRAQLCAPTFEVGSRGIQVEPKDKVTERLGESPDRADSVVMAWYEGIKGINPADHRYQPQQKQQPKVILGYQTRR